MEPKAIITSAAPIKATSTAFDGLLWKGWDPRCPMPNVERQLERKQAGLLPERQCGVVNASSCWFQSHQVLFLRDRLASFDSLPQDPRLTPSAGVKVCTYHRRFGRPQNAACPSYWESPMGNAKLHRNLRFRMGSHHLPVEVGRHFSLPRASRVCNLYNTGALGDERHMLLATECPALADLRLQFSSLLLSCSSPAS